MSRFCGWTRRSQATLCAWVVLLVVEACTSHAGLNHCAACEHMSSVGVGCEATQYATCTFIHDVG